MALDMALGYFMGREYLFCAGVCWGALSYRCYLRGLIRTIGGLVVLAII